MTLSQQKIVTPNQLDTEQVFQDEIKEKVMQLFASSHHAAFTEERMHDQFTALTSAFLEEDYASTDIHFNSLLENFCDSNVPDEPSSF